MFLKNGLCSRSAMLRAFQAGGNSGAQDLSNKPKSGVIRTLSPGERAVDIACTHVRRPSSAIPRAKPVIVEKPFREAGGNCRGGRRGFREIGARDG